MRRYIFFLTCSLAMGCGLAFAQPSPIPVPRPKPPEIGGPPEAGAPPRPAPSAPKNEDKETKKEEKADEGPRLDETCLLRLRSLGVLFDQVAVPSAPNTACIIDTPVRLKAVAAAGRTGLVRL